MSNFDWRSHAHASNFDPPRHSLRLILKRNDNDANQTDTYDN